MSGSFDESIAQLLDHQAIVRLTHTYCWALDSKNMDLLDEVFAPDATAELRSAPLHGRDAIRDRIAAALAPLDATQHTVTNHHVVIDGDRATSRCYLHSQHVRAAAEGGPLYVIAGRYEDDLVRTPDGWRIVSRRLVQVWTDGNLEVVLRRVS